MALLGFTWFLFAILVGVLASKYGRSGLGWFILATIISPLFAGLFLIVAILPGKDGKKVSGGTASAVCFAASDGPTKKCPFCAELIKFDAIKCKHCGEDVRPAEEAARSQEHVFTVTCYECESTNEISSATAHNFPKCMSCGKNVIDLNRKKHKNALLAYINEHRGEIKNSVYNKLIEHLE